MIILITGTNGSGKSTLVRSIMGYYLNSVSLHERGHKKPMGYKCTNPGSAAPPLHVIGHYEIDCGGMDTIKPPKLAQRYVNDTARLSVDILMEGEAVTTKPWLKDLMKLGCQLNLVLLTTSIAECMQGVRQRGHQIGNGRVRKTSTRVFNVCQALEQYGAHLHYCTRASALPLLCGLLRLPAPTP